MPAFVGLDWDMNLEQPEDEIGIRVLTVMLTIDPELLFACA